jgi:hypothetical protein
MKRAFETTEFDNFSTPSTTSIPNDSGATAKVFPGEGIGGGNHRLCQVDRTSRTSPQRAAQTKAEEI